MSLFKKDDSRDKIEASRRMVAGDIPEDPNIVSVLPKRINDKLGYKAWTALSWALQHQWVQDYKYLFSEAISKKGGGGRLVDFGTPKTVKYLLFKTGLIGLSDEEHDIKLSSLVRDDFGSYIFTSSRIGKERVQDFYELMVEGYLTGTDFVSKLWVMKPFGKSKPDDLIKTGVVYDRNGDNQLEGELRRYRAIKHNKGCYLYSGGLSALIPQLDDYCKEYFLSDETKENLVAKLRL